MQRSAYLDPIKQLQETKRRRSHSIHSADLTQHAIGFVDKIEAAKDIRLSQANINKKFYFLLLHKVPWQQLQSFDCDPHLLSYPSPLLIIPHNSSTGISEEYRLHLSVVCLFSSRIVLQLIAAHPIFKRNCMQISATRWWLR